MTENDLLEEQLIDSIPPLASDSKSPSLASLQQTIRRRKLRRWVAATSLGLVVCVIGSQWRNRGAPESIAVSDTESELPNTEQIVAANDDAFRVIETWTTAVPVVYEHPESKELRQGWQIQEFRRPVNPRTLGSSERASVYRVLFDRSQPPGPEL